MLSMLLWATLAQAQEPDWQEHSAAEFEEPESELSVEVGGTYTSGNSVLYQISGGLEGTHKWDRNKLGLKARATVGASKQDTDGDGILEDSEREGGFKQNAQRYGGELRYDRFLSDDDSLYALAGGFRDPFAGFDLRTHEQIGYSRQILDLRRVVGEEAEEGAAPAEGQQPAEGEEAEEPVKLKTVLRAELGLDWAQENYVAGVDPNTRQIIAARAMVGFTHQFTESTSFANTVEVYENVRDPVDLRVLNDATFSTKLNAMISLKLSHSLIFDNQPVEGYRPFDQTTMVTLVASIL